MPSIRLATLCSWFGVTRQAYYQKNRRYERLGKDQDVVLSEVYRIRKDHRKLGGRKLYVKIQPVLQRHHIKMGRDAFFNLLRHHQLLVRPRRRSHVTTRSYQWMRKYPNLIKDRVPTAPNQIWCSDITYWKPLNKYYYISFITDTYSRKIVGYHVAENLETVQSVRALRMALASLRKNPTQLIHHSDRGSQYCSDKYVRILKQRGIAISMTEHGDPLENAIAERLNGIMKSEYLEGCKVKTLKEAQAVLAKAVDLYNLDRPHSSISNCFPNEVHQQTEQLHVRRLWKNYYSSVERNRSTVVKETGL